MLLHRSCLVFFLLAVSIQLFSQPKCYFEHYGTDDGLPQHTVMSILQDKKGFLWFSTWDGLCKFDGYTFTTYKIQQGDSYHMRSNRIDFITEDKYGNVWTLPYDREPQRFDPRTETFMGLRSLPEYKDFNFQVTKILSMPSGKIWLLSDQMGCVCVVDSTFKVELYNIDNKKIQANKVFTVHEDSDNNTWILTNNGLYKISEGGIVNNVFSGKEISDSPYMQDFYSVEELDSEIWFGSDDGRVWVYTKSNGRFELLKTGSPSGIRHIKNVNDSHILLATEKDGFYIRERYSGVMKKYNSSNLQGMDSNEIISCYIDKSRNIWFEMNDFGVYKFNLYTQQMKHFVMKTESAIMNVFEPNFFIFEDKENRLWVHPRGGGFAYYDSVKDELLPFYNEPYSPSWRFSNMMHAAFSDQQGNLWLSTRSHGLEKVIFNNDVFLSSIIDPNIHSTTNNDIRALMEDHNQNLWVSTKGGKVYIYDKSRKQIGYICENGTISAGKALPGITYCMLEDADRNIWLGTKGEGIYRLIPQENTHSYRIEHYINAVDDLYSLSHNSVYSIFRDNKKRIWVGTYGGGLNLFDEESKRFINHKSGLKNYPIQFGSQVRIVSSDKYGNVCVGTTLGLIMFSPNFDFPGAISYKSYIRIPDNDKSISGNDIYDICTTTKGETYIATFGGGLNKIDEVDNGGMPVGFVSYTSKDGLPSDVILTLTEDRAGKLWLATEGNLTKFDPVSISFETYSEINRQMMGQNFSEGSRVTTKDGIVYFGYSKGYISINPEKVSTNTFEPYVALTKLQIANKDVHVGENSPLKESFDDIKYLKLNHKQNFISIEFAALDFIESKRISYTYKLEGFDEDWVVIGKQRIANYTNLSPGKYMFRVRSTNSDGIWMNNEHSLEIEITPSFWQTGWAYMLYVLLIILTLFIVLRVLFVFYRLRDKVRLEHEETEMKTRFFTDISHEIRTPLTMIVSPVENIIDDETTPVDVKSQLQLVLKNANRMLRMVNQILDFRKIQKLNLNIQETPIGEYVLEICNNFSKTAEAQGINLKISNRAGNEKIWIDRDSIEKLVFNLLSNAIKYTPMGKTIEVSVFHTRKDNAIALQVRDEGRGMSKDILNKLFVRFASFNKDKNKPSTGIGLSIVKEVADKHHAKVLVDSEVDEGSSFTVLFPMGLEHFKDDTTVTFVQPESISKEDNLKEDKQQSDKNEGNLSQEISDTQKYTILVAEDDTDLRKFIVTILSPYYDLLEAPDGKVGYELATDKLPDFIISDIMMPEVDGVEFLKKVRSNNETSHIPFILLSAKTDMETKLSGLDYGADDYITKPFSVKYLKARIDNIIRQRKHLYDVYTGMEPDKQPPVNEPGNDAIQPVIVHQLMPQDEEFLRKIKEEVEKNIDDSDFLIDDLASAMAMSRTVFFKKLKSLTGFAPVEFVRDIKIKYAADMLKTQKYTVKEVSYMVGISDTKYFTQCFKKVYGKTPGEYKNSQD